LRCWIRYFVTALHSGVNKREKEKEKERKKSLCISFETREKTNGNLTARILDLAARCPLIVDVLFGFVLLQNLAPNKS
jgi:hypothetical protein